jgi:hypothetical protein
MPLKPSGAVEDPTKNVRSLSKADVRRQDDLRKAQNRLIRTEIKHLCELLVLHAAHSREMREQNNERLAALRLVDISTRNEDRKTADDAIRRLAEQTESLRQTLSKQVADTAETLSKAKAESDKATEVRISSLEKTSYTGAGEKAIADPAIAQLVAEVRSLAQSRAGDTGRSVGANQLWGYIVGVLGLIAILSKFFVK